MKLQRALNSYLRQHFPQDVQQEPWCTCGNANHVRMYTFRVDGHPATAIVPEGCELSAEVLRRVFPGTRVDPLSEAELDSIYADTELGHMQPFDNPFGTSVYLDANLAQFETLVFCPKMFSGQTGECFRVPTHEFQALVHALVVKIFPTFRVTSQA